MHSLCGVGAAVLPPQGPADERNNYFNYFNYSNYSNYFNNYFNNLKITLTHKVVLNLSRPNAIVTEARKLLNHKLSNEI